jgi:hypothetical protein
LTWPHQKRAYTDSNTQGAGETLRGTFNDTWDRRNPNAHAKNQAVIDKGRSEIEAARARQYQKQQQQQPMGGQQGMPGQQGMSNQHGIPGQQQQGMPNHQSFSQQQSISQPSPISPQQSIPHQESFSHQQSMPQQHQHHPSIGPAPPPPSDTTPQSQSQAQAQAQTSPTGKAPYQGPPISGSQIEGRSGGGGGKLSNIMKKMKEGPKASANRDDTVNHA